MRQGNYALQRNVGWSLDALHDTSTRSVHDAHDWMPMLSSTYAHCGHAWAYMVAH